MTARLNPFGYKYRHSIRYKLCNAVFCAALLGGCASSKPAAPTPSPAVQSAQALEQRAGKAFAQGDFERALKDFDTAASVYASLAMTDAHAQAQLNGARVLADSGQTAAAQVRVAAVLASVVPLSASVRTTAYGRAAALALANADLPLATTSLAAAQAACSASCPASAALAVLAARLQLANGKAVEALVTANQAVKLAPMPSNTAMGTANAQQADHANALRVRAQAHAALQSHGAALADAQAALAVDQTLGFAARVALDLQLMAAAQRGLGMADAAARSSALAEQSLAASQRLHGDK